MDEWEKSLNSFLDAWRDKDFVVGAVACGSFVYGTATSTSDIDVHIITDKSLDWRERGNLVVDGFLIEYFVNPVQQIRAYFVDERKNHHPSTAHMFMLGKILFDKTGIVKQLVEEAKSAYKEEFDSPPNFEVEIAKYSMQDGFDNLKDTTDKEFWSVYFSLLNQTYENYAKYLRQNIVGIAKRERYFTEQDFRTKYHLERFPDQKFSEQYIEALEVTKREHNFDILRQLINHTQEQMGGFSLDGWKLKGPAHTLDS